MQCLASEVMNAALESSSRFRAVQETCPGAMPRYQVSVRDCLVCLTCVCGTRCILRYSRAATAASWACSFLTVTTESVRGAIQQANCVTLSLPSGSALSLLDAHDDESMSLGWLLRHQEYLGAVEPGQGDGGST
jgi:hypothetical protein